MLLERVSYVWTTFGQIVRLGLCGKDFRGAFNADERTRTSTRLLPQRPERCASTSSATSAPEVRILLSEVGTVKQPRFSIRALLESRAARRSRTRNAHRSSSQVLRLRPTGHCD